MAGSVYVLSALSESKGVQICHSEGIYFFGMVSEQLHDN
jgi:hypothetical protein